MAKYRKRPVVIEAEQFFAVHTPWPEGVILLAAEDAQGSDGKIVSQLPARHNIQTLEGPLLVVDGDWIITGIKGEKYPCKPDIFEATYEPVTEEVFNEPSD